MGSGRTPVTDGTRLYFEAYDEEHGVELWASDGTAEGTYLVKDVRPGPESPELFEFAFAGGRLYFTANDGVHGFELWTSDGTAEGTSSLDLCDGECSSFPGLPRAFGDLVYFPAHDEQAGNCATAKRDIERRVDALGCRLGRAHVGPHRDVHADVTGESRKDSTDGKADGGAPVKREAEYEIVGFGIVGQYPETGKAIRRAVGAETDIAGLPG